MIPIPEIAAGELRAWKLLEKLGEGDAGEVYRVESLIEHKIAILKRPRRNGFPSDSIRQAAQIEQEAHILRSLTRIQTPGSYVRAPELLDQSKTGSEYSDRFFIVVSIAKGINLSSLARIARFGLNGDFQKDLYEHQNLPSGNQRIIQYIGETGRISSLLLLRACAGLIDYLELIHKIEVDTPAGKAYGVLWNDIKPDHIFWEPLTSRFTLIDWGNARFLDADGITKDRLHSRLGDYQQFLSEMGQFLLEVAPDLHRELEWPRDFTSLDVYSAGIMPLKARILACLEEETEKLRQAREVESRILQATTFDLESLNQLQAVQQQILSNNELPDYSGAERYFFNLAAFLVQDNQLSQTAQLCDLAENVTLIDADTCLLLRRLTVAASSTDALRQVLLASLAGDWLTALWDLCLATFHTPPDPHRNDLIDSMRFRITGSTTLRPLVALNRVIHSLQANIQKNPDDLRYIELYQRLREEILPRWQQTEPDPPNSGLEYTEIERYFEDLLSLTPEAGQSLLHSLDQPRAQVNLVLDAWERKDFETARRALRQLLAWDPDRNRVFLADKALSSVPAWLAMLSSGPGDDEPLQDFITRLELIGREFRNQIGPSIWLDALLDSFKQLRKGAEPTDVLVEHPQARDELAWLIVLEPRRPILVSSNRALSLERSPISGEDRPVLYGTRESLLGVDDGILLADPLDTWASEARGSSARSFLGELPLPKGARRQAALKIMRPDQADYALPLFSEEARILTQLRDTPGVNILLECGFIKLDQVNLPPEDRHASGRELSGKALRFGVDSVHLFLNDLEKRVAQGWLPYLALEKQERADNLLLLCDVGYTHGRFMPILEALIIAIQICDILEIAHSRNIVYRDHKILHYYWQSEYNGVFIIDWNIARRFPEGLSPADIQFDLVQFGARALHYLFTGRAAPGALPMSANRPEEIEAADHSYTVQWTYDDQRLPKDIKDLLEAVLAGTFYSARSLREELLNIYRKLSELA